MAEGRLSGNIVRFYFILLLVCHFYLIHVSAHQMNTLIKHSSLKLDLGKLELIWKTLCWFVWAQREWSDTCRTFFLLISDLFLLCISLLFLVIITRVWYFSLLYCVCFTLVPMMNRSEGYCVFNVSKWFLVCLVKKKEKKKWWWGKNAVKLVFWQGDRWNI